MKPEIFKEKFEKAFEWYGIKSSGPGLLRFQLEHYKKLWNLLQVGDAYYFIIDHRTLSFELVSNEVEDVLGYDPLEFDIPFMISKIHPDDRSWFLSIGQGIVDFLSQLPMDKIKKYKLRYDIRFQKKSGEYIRILYQGVVLEHDEQGRFIRTLGVHTDITHLKDEGRPVLSFIGMEGEPSFCDIASNNIFIENKEELTGREKQVLKLLIEGKMSKEISGALKISKQTVDTHRRNMLRKKNLGNTCELIGKAIKFGWI
jgi:DNA-binding CsgD family transcriptional regulator